MPNHRHHQLPIPTDDSDRLSRLSPDPFQSHTHVQLVARCIHVDKSGRDV